MIGHGDVMSPAEQAAYKHATDFSVQPQQPQQYVPQQPEQTVDPVAVAEYMRQRKLQDAAYLAQHHRNNYYGD